MRLTPGVSLKAGPHLRLSLGDTFERLSVDEGRLFRAHLVQTRIAWQFNVRAMARAILQYTDVRRDPDLYATSACPDFDPVTFVPPETVTKTLFTQLLLSYKVSPQTALYLGYTEDRLSETGASLTQTGRTFFFKIGYAWLP